MLKYLLFVSISDYKQDPYSHKDPMNAICSRGDLQHQPYAGGCIDTKVQCIAQYMWCDIWCCRSCAFRSQTTMAPCHWLPMQRAAPHIRYSTSHCTTFSLTCVIVCESINILSHMVRRNCVVITCLSLGPGSI